MRWSSSSAGILLNIFWILIACSRKAIAKLSPDENHFINPPPTSKTNPVYELGDVQDISWMTTMDVFNITIWQRDPTRGTNTSGVNIFSKTNPKDKITNFTWVVQPYTFNLAFSPVFFISLGADDIGFITTPFNITPSASSSPTAAESESNTTRFPTDTDTDTNPDAVDPSSSPIALTSTGKIALGLGVGVGVPLISLLAILAYLQYKNANTEKQQSTTTYRYTPPPPLPPQYYPAMTTDPMMRRNLVPSELPPKTQLGSMRSRPPWEVLASASSTSTSRTGDGRGVSSMGIPELPGQDYI